MKTKKSISFLLVLVAVVLTTGCTSKYHKKNYENRIFKKFDKNHDGYLDKKEHLNLCLLKKI